MVTREIISGHIIERLERDKDTLKADFETDRGIDTRFAVIDGLLPPELANMLYAAFPNEAQMRLLDSFRERKFTSNSLDRFDPLITEATFAFQDQRVIDSISEMTSVVDAIADPFLYAGGISAMTRGHFLNPHIDNSHDHDRKNFRVLNLLYYVTPDWNSSNGGSLEFWDKEVKEYIEIPSLFNRLVIMSTSDRSIHSVGEVTANRTRRCISNYYFSPYSPNRHEKAHVTYFHARPDQRIRRVLTKADSEVRSLLRRVKKSGFSRKDLFLMNRESEEIVSED